MLRPAVAAVLSVALAVGCAEPTNPPPPAKDRNVDVHAPGVDVKVRKTDDGQRKVDVKVEHP